MNEPIDELKARRQLQALRVSWGQALDADAHNIDADMIARLQAAREAALAGSMRRERRVLRGSWWMAPVAAAMLVVSIWLPSRMPATPAAGVAPPSTESAEVAVWQEESELLDELDFYTWLEVEADHAS